MIVERVVVSSLRANCFIVGMEDSKEGLIVDPGGEADEILRKVDKMKLTIKLIVLTHGHSDHIGALYEVQKAIGAEVAIHSVDVSIIRGGGNYSSMFGISYRSTQAPIRVLNDGDEIEVGKLHFMVIHTPGHTPGCICLYGHNAVFTGDTLFYHGVGTTYTCNSSRSELIGSIHSRLMNLPDDTIVYPGHGRATTIGAERKDNRSLHSRW